MGRDCRTGTGAFTTRFLPDARDRAVDDPFGAGLRAAGFVDAGRLAAALGAGFFFWGGVAAKVVAESKAVTMAAVRQR
uniref:Uncharacterized protein n=1 Tax=uncultured bacterium 246 TaxID=698384 RepID=E3T6D4_9BACT|nr:hypothetical protein [uncultured bacterium 246]